MPHPTISIVVAVAQDGAIGKEQQLLCYLPNDLKQFKALTMHHTIVMGRLTFESLPNGALPHRTNVVLTRQSDLVYPNTTMCHTLEEALSHAADGEELFVIGGGAIYREAMPLAHKLYITEIAHTFEGADTFFPAIDLAVWQEVSRESHEVDEKHRYPYAFVAYERR